MNRTDFINHFKVHSPEEANPDWPFLEFKILLTSTANSDYLNLMYVNSKLETMYESLNISNGYLLSKGELDFEYDYYYEDDNPDSDYCQYKADLNLNILYDKLVESHVINNPELISLYRIETAGHKGLYDGVGYNILLSAPEDKHPGPEKDLKFMKIFDHNGYLLDNMYKSKWMFAFADENQFKEWISTKAVFDQLVEADFKLNKITIKADNAIIGDAQAIYIGKTVEKTEILPLNTLEHLFIEKRKNKFTV